MGELLTTKTLNHWFIFRIESEEELRSTLDKIADYGILDEEVSIVNPISTGVPDKLLSGGLYHMRYCGLFSHSVHNTDMSIPKGYSKTKENSIFKDIVQVGGRKVNPISKN